MRTGKLRIPHVENPRPRKNAAADGTPVDAARGQAIASRVPVTGASVPGVTFSRPGFVRGQVYPDLVAAPFSPFAQQCVEKYLKGRMADAGMVVPRTHDLAALLDALLPLEPLWEAARPRLEVLEQAQFSRCWRWLERHERCW